MIDPMAPRTVGLPKTLWRIVAGGFGVGLLCLVSFLLFGGSYHVLLGVDQDDTVSSRQDDTVSSRDVPRGCPSETARAVYGADERRWNWDGADSVEVALPDVTLRYGVGIGRQIVASGSRAALAHIEVRDGEIRSSCDNFPWGRVVITLPATQFRHIGIEGLGRVEMTGVDQPELELRIMGPGFVQGQGRIQDVSVDIQGPGTARLADLAMDSLKVDIAGPGRVEADAKAKADISIMGPGNVRMVSRPPKLQAPTN